MKRHFTTTRLTFALAAWASSIGLLQAASTPATAPIQGHAPVLSAPSNGAKGTVDFTGTYATPGILTTSDTLVMTYTYSDSDGDLDNSLTTVVWSYVDAQGQTVTIPAINVPAPALDDQGTSSIIIPAGATGAAAISVTLQEYAATGVPISGNIITVSDTSAGGGTVTPPGPVAPGSNVAAGIFLQSDNPGAGSSATDYSRTSTYPQVGATYVFRAWDDVNGNGVWEAGEADLTATLNSIQWQLDGTNTSASGSPTTLRDYPITGATTDTYQIPVNSLSSSGAVPGDQGFTLKVDFN
ncbi:SinI family autotransporter-associated protein [Chania multitudinisentens]|uniref:SinI family autotransporter-associated protein n=1 Tax=Chania multitudinisentens TaxID=1639108 RepID=UPI0003E12DE0|nr:SinI family autotransporter-associated protein [Chania multitudinisentens]